MTNEWGKEEKLEQPVEYLAYNGFINAAIKAPYLDCASL